MPVKEVTVSYSLNDGSYPFYMKYVMVADIEYAELDEDSFDKLENCEYFDIVDVSPTRVVCLVDENKDINEQCLLFKIAIEKCVPRQEKSVIVWENIKHLDKVMN